MFSLNSTDDRPSDLGAVDPGSTPGQVIRQTLKEGVVPLFCLLFSIKGEVRQLVVPYQCNGPGEAAYLLCMPFPSLSYESW